MDTEDFVVELDAVLDQWAQNNAFTLFFANVKNNTTGRSFGTAGSRGLGLGMGAGAGDGESHGEGYGEGADSSGGDADGYGDGEGEGEHTEPTG